MTATTEEPNNTPAFADVEGLSITAEAWESMTPAERSVAAVVAAARRREFVPDNDASLVRALAVAARGEFVPRSRPFDDLHEALWSVFGDDQPNGALWGLLWDPEVHALSFVPIGAPGVRCTNLWFGRPEADAVQLDSNNGPAGPAPVLLWASDGEVAEGIRDWCGAEAAAGAELAALRASLADGTASDGFHSFAELYESRLALHAYAVEAWQARGWPVVKSWRHDDGERCFGGGWCIVHVVTSAGPASFHYPASAWELFDVPAVETAPAFDGHTTADVHARLRAALGDRTPAPATRDARGAYARAAEEFPAVAAAAAAANGPVRERVLDLMREAGADLAHYDVTTNANGFEAWRRPDAPPQESV